MTISPSVYAPPRLTPEAIALIKHFEGCFLESYRDPVGIWTVGYGHTGDVKRGCSLSQREAEDLLLEDLDMAQVDVRHNVKVPLNENEFGALVSLAFNIGGAALAGSTLLRKLNKGDRTAAAKEFERFVYGHVGGRKVMLRGLQIRRRAEREMFQSPLGQLVRDGHMVLAGRTIPVEHASHDLAQARSPSGYPSFPAAVQGLLATEAEREGHAKMAGRAYAVTRSAPRVSRATLISVGAGAAVGAIPATHTPAAQDLVYTVSDIWQKLGGTEFFPSLTSWTRWAEAIGGAVAEVRGTGSLTPLLSYLAQFLQSHEALIVALATIAVILIRSGLGGLLMGRDRGEI